MAAARRRACLAAWRASQNPKALANPLQDGTGLLGRCLGNLIPLGDYIRSRVRKGHNFLLKWLQDWFKAR